MLRTTIPTERRWTRHRLFIVVLGLGLLVRLMTVLAFRDPVSIPALAVGPEAESPTGSALDGPHVGYALLLRLLGSDDGSHLVPAVQHAVALAAAVLLYHLLCRWGVWRGVAALACLPACAGPHVVMSAQVLTPAVWVVLLLIAIIACLCWRASPGAGAAVLAGLLAGAVATVYPAGLFVLLVVLFFVLLAGHGFGGRMADAAASVVGFAVPVAAYVGWQHARGGAYHGGLTDVIAVRGWSGFGFDRLTSLFGTTSPGRGGTSFATYEHDSGSHAPIGALVDYGHLVGAPLWPWLVAATAAVVASLGIGRAGASRMQATCALVVALPIAVVVGPLLTGDDPWTGVVAMAVLWPAAGALGLTAMMRGRRGRGVDRPQHDEVDQAAMASFDERYDRPTLAPVVIVIAAYNEAKGLPAVLDTMPTRLADNPVDVVVVDDGSSDGTVDAVLAHPRVRLVAGGRNRGQGAALRLGYWVAREHGARYIITTDADGQYDPADMPAVIEPLLSNRADFVTGSRRLGHQHTFDRFRRLGVHVFAHIVSAMVGQHVTDTSFGLRAMRAETTGHVTLNQPQYQSSELMLGMFSHGYRVLEVPGTMHLRSSGTTKKGRNLVYGRRYAGVVFTTWWREGCPRPVTERARALRSHRMT